MFKLKACLSVLCMALLNLGFSEIITLTGDDCIDTYTHKSTPSVYFGKADTLRVQI